MSSIVRAHLQRVRLVIAKEMKQLSCFTPKEGMNVTYYCTDQLSFARLFLCSVIDNDPDLQAVVPASHTHTVMAIAAAIAIQARDFFGKKKPALLEGKTKVKVINRNKEQGDKKAKEVDMSEEEEKQDEVTEKEIAVEVTEVVVTITEEEKETDDTEVEVTGMEKLIDVKVTSDKSEKLTEEMTEEEEEVEKEEVTEEGLKEKAKCMEALKLKDDMTGETHEKIAEVFKEEQVLAMTVMATKKEVEATED